MKLSDILKAEALEYRFRVSYYTYTYIYNENMFDSARENGEMISRILEIIFKSGYVHKQTEVAHFTTEGVQLPASYRMGTFIFNRIINESRICACDWLIG